MRFFPLKNRFKIYTMSKIVSIHSKIVRMLLSGFYKFISCYILYFFKMLFAHILTERKNYIFIFLGDTTCNLKKAFILSSSLPRRSVSLNAKLFAIFATRSISNDDYLHAIETPEHLSRY